MTFDRLIPEILFGFMGLVGIINPFGMAFVFLERTQSRNTNAIRSGWRSCSSSARNR